ncbi:MAG TPA: phosphatase PAP2 family protein [Gemmatimonadaceae bacterium]
MLAVRHRSALLSLVLLASAAGPPLAGAPLGAQPSDTSTVSTAPLFTARDAIWAVVFTGTSIALFQFDEKIHRWVQRPGIQDDELLADASRIANYANENRLMLAGLAAYGIGKLAGKPNAADIGFHVFEAVGVSTVLNTAVRGALGRRRPYATEPIDAFAFDGWEGFSDFDFRAFPSIHASANFSAAAALTAEVRRRWPGATWWVGIASYGLATLPTLSRLHQGRHWASDLVMGGFVGTLTGLKIVQYHHSHPRNVIDRIFLHATPVAGAGRAGLVVRATF